LQSEDLAGEATASLKLLTGVGEIVGNATGGVLLEGCDVWMAVMSGRHVAFLLGNTALKNASLLPFWQTLA